MAVDELATKRLLLPRRRNRVRVASAGEEAETERASFLTFDPTPTVSGDVEELSLDGPAGSVEVGVAVAAEEGS